MAQACIPQPRTALPRDGYNPPYHCTQAVSSGWLKRGAAQLLQDARSAQALRVESAALLGAASLGAMLWSCSCGLWHALTGPTCGSRGGQRGGRPEACWRL